MKKGQTCAACVVYPEHNKYAWIITKIDKKLSGKQHKYQVRDEYYTDPKHELYVVDEKRVTPFPIHNGKYKVGERILAMWHDEQTNEWSTMLYVAEIVEMKSSKRLLILYQGSDETVEIDVDHVTKFPPDFDLSNESFYDEPAEGEPTDNAHTDDDNAAADTADADQTTDKRESESTEREEDRNFEKTENGSNEEDRTDDAQDISDDADQEQRRIHFLFKEPAPVEKLQIQCLNDKDFTDLAGPSAAPPRMTTVEGTPLLDSLSDPELFSQDFNSHITGSGRLSAPKIRSKGRSFLSPQTGIQCGRLSYILGEWSNTHS